MKIGAVLGDNRTCASPFPIGSGKTRQVHLIQDGERLRLLGRNISVTLAEARLIRLSPPGRFGAFREEELVNGFESFPNARLKLALELWRTRFLGRNLREIPKGPPRESSEISVFLFDAIKRTGENHPA